MKIVSRILHDRCRHRAIDIDAKLIIRKPLLRADTTYFESITQRAKRTQNRNDTYAIHSGIPFDDQLKSDLLAIVLNFQTRNREDDGRGERRRFPKFVRRAKLTNVYALLRLVGADADCAAASR